MVKHLLKILFLVICVCSFSCKKYEDGPNGSVYTKKARLANKWKIETYFLNGIDKTYEYRQTFTSETLQFFKSGKFQSIEASTWSWAGLTYGGSWNFTDKKESLEMFADDTTVGNKLFKILRLKNNELWLRREFSPDSIVEFHYVTQTDAN